MKLVGTQVPSPAVTFAGEGTCVPNFQRKYTLFMASSDILFIIL